MRTKFSWEWGLSQSTFERCLLLLGLLPPSIARHQALPTAAELGAALVGRWRRLGGMPWFWRLRPPTEQLLDAPEAVPQLAAAGEILLRETRRNPFADSSGLRVEATVPDRVDGAALAAALSAGGADSVYLRLKEEGDVTWDWPLRIAVGGDSELLGDISPTNSLRRLFRAHRMESAPVRFNLLFLEASLAAAAARLASGARLTTDAIVVFGGLGAAGGLELDSVARSRAATGAQGVFVFDSPDVGVARHLVERLIRELSHGLALDSAVGKLAGVNGLPMFSWSTRALALAASVREQGRLIAKRMQRMRGSRIRVSSAVRDAMIEVDVVCEAHPGTFRTGSGETGTWERAEELGVELERRLPRRGARREPAPAAETSASRGMSFDAESSGASAIADLAEAVAEALRDDAEELPHRFLQVRVETPAGRAVEGSRPLRPDREYQACVLIGARRRRWLGLAEPVDEPPPRPDGQPVTLQIMFWEPTVCPQPRVLPLKLFPTGDTGVVAFPFRTAAPGDFAARIAVYHRNRNLQTGLLRGVVGDEPSALSFTLDAAPHPRFVGLQDRGVIGASIVVNDDPCGRMRAFTYRDGTAAVADVSDRPVGVDPGRGLDQLTAALGRCISRITRNPEDYSDLAKEGSRQLLLDLALHGSALLRRLCQHDDLGDRFDGVEHVQIVRAHVDAFFPAEFLYAGEPPEDDAKICSGAAAAEQALRQGRCCGAYADDAEHTICPLKFWSLSKVIERHAHRPEHARLGKPFQLHKVPASQRQRVLDPLAGAILAASDRVDLAVPDTVANLHAKLDAVVRKRPVATVSDWSAWAAEIGKTHPHLLVLLPHHEHKGGFDLLEIGAGQTRKSMQIRAEHVCPQGIPTSPVVLLIGCETESARVDLESFVPGYFQDAGAAIVVSTVASILGRQAGPAAAVLVEESRRIQDDEDATFGQAMLAARRRLLAEGTPMVLGLTSYGDADWRIAAGSDP